MAIGRARKNKGASEENREKWALYSTTFFTDDHQKMNRQMESIFLWKKLKELKIYVKPVYGPMSLNEAH